MSTQAEDKGRRLAMRGAAGDGTARPPFGGPSQGPVPEDTHDTPVNYPAPGDEAGKPPFGGASQGKPPEPPPPPDPSYPVPGDPERRRAGSEPIWPLDEEPEEPDR